METQVAALFVLPDGPYAHVEGVELWDEIRDARSYAGPFLVHGGISAEFGGEDAMTDQSKQWIITEQGIKEAAKEIADFQRKGEERGLVLREHIIAGMITKHAQTAPGPSCTLCGSPMAFQCPKCGSTPQPIEAAPQRKRGEKWERVDLQLLEDALFIAQAVDANEDRAERMRLTGEVIHELIKSRAAAPPQGTPKPEPDRCPRCASTDKLFLHNACYEECQECPHPWHSTVAAQKEKP